MNIFKKIYFLIFKDFLSQEERKGGYECPQPFRTPHKDIFDYINIDKRYRRYLFHLHLFCFLKDLLKGKFSISRVKYYYKNYKSNFMENHIKEFYNPKNAF